MIIPWPDLKKECPLAIQVIEKKTGFNYSGIYGSLLNADDNAIMHHDIEKFFDDHGWFMTVYPTSFPGWNGIITDTNGNQVYNDSGTFAEVNSRNHAKSLLTGIAIKLFQEAVLKLMVIPPDAFYLNDDALIESAKCKELDQLQMTDIITEHSQRIAYEDCVLFRRGDLVFVIKSKESLPQPGMILTIKK